MSAPFVLALRLLLAASLYGFLVLALFTLWREIKNQGENLAARKTPSIGLQIQSGEGSLVRRFFNQPDILLGRDSHCDITLNDETVSVRHARLSFHHGQWWLEDLGSTNGTRLNKEKLSIPTVVIGGDQIECGNSLLSLDLGADLGTPATQQIEPEGDSDE
jgi:pSer/pThr/pTyr-binding forkhead associated (FHA) protein